MRGQRGYATITIVLALLIVGSLVIIPLLGFVAVGQKAGRTANSNMQRFYACDSGIEDAYARINSDSLPDYFQGVWSLYTIRTPFSYDLPVEINGCKVEVTIRACPMEDIWRDTKLYQIDSSASGEGRQTSVTVSYLVDYDDNSTHVQSYIIK